MSNQQSVNQLNPDIPQHKPVYNWENWSLPTTSQLHHFCTTWSLLRTILDPASWWLSQSCDSYAAAFCSRDVGPNGPNNKHSLEEHLWHVGSTTSTVASLRVARLGWLPSQAKLPLHDSWRRTWQMCQWPWNVKSTIGKQSFRKTNWIALEKLLATYNFPASPLLLCMISTRVAVPKLWFLRSCLLL